MFNDSPARPSPAAFHDEASADSDIKEPLLRPCKEISGDDLEDHPTCVLGWFKAEDGREHTHLLRDEHSIDFGSCRSALCVMSLPESVPFGSKRTCIANELAVDLVEESVAACHACHGVSLAVVLLESRDVVINVVALCAEVLAFDRRAIGSCFKPDPDRFGVFHEDGLDAEDCKQPVVLIYHPDWFFDAELTHQLIPFPVSLNNHRASHNLMEVVIVELAESHNF